MRILLRTSPPKIAKMIIGFISIPMSYFMLFGRRPTMPRLTDEAMDAKRSLFPARQR